jgi:chemotaxis protein histidine kinase CheA
VNQVFRAENSIKGGAGFFGLTKIQELAHKTENVLDLMRSGEMTPTPEAVSVTASAGRGQCDQPGGGDCDSEHAGLSTHRSRG